MAKPFEFGGVRLNAQEGDLAADESRQRKPASDSPFIIALLGDFSGRAHRGVFEAEAIDSRPALLVDRDNFEEILAIVEPRLRLSLDEGSPVELRFSELEDFHPDRIFERSGLFHKLREVRANLRDSCADAVKQSYLEGEGRTPKRQQSENSRPPSVTSMISGNLLEATISETETHSAPAERTLDKVREFARRAVEPHLVRGIDAHQGELLALTDEAITALMRALLHHPEFQALEAAWRAVSLLVRRIETGSQLKLYLIDASKQELAADLGRTAEVSSKRLYRKIVEGGVGTLGGETWSVITGNYAFGPSARDAELLSQAGKIASAAGAPFLAAARPQLLGCNSLADSSNPRNWGIQEGTPGAASWAQLRRGSHAQWIGLTMPRFLLRLPYGKKTVPVESFDFEEMTDPCSHEDYLWGNPAFVCALLLAQAFSVHGWDMYPGQISELNGLPLHVFERNGAPELKPCAEVLLTEHAAEQMAERGIMPLVSYKGREAAALVRFQSIADPLRPLAGQWRV